jgi:hypothetical protein
LKKISTPPCRRSSKLCNVSNSLNINRRLILFGSPGAHLSETSAPRGTRRGQNSPAEIYENHKLAATATAFSIRQIAVESQCRTVCRWRISN